MDPKKIKLDPEEQWIDDHVEEFVPVSTEEKQRFGQAMAKARKDHTISLRLNGTELLELKQIARQECLPYQTFVSSILHKYLTHQLIDAREVKKILALMKK
ncbi:MAG: antitoxin [Patescibacteria group bacterium]